MNLNSKLKLIHVKNESEAFLSYTKVKVYGQEI